MIKIKRALISVWDKTNLKEFAKFLIDNYIEIISTGGTMTFLKNNGFDVTPVSKITNCKYIMDGRVKTLHPKIFGGILADRDNPSHLEDLVDIEAGIIDLVVVNLYPFKEEVVEKNLDLKKAIEFIDIGGPSMLRAAAKNYQHVIPISQVSEYERFMNLFISNKGLFPLKERKEFALRVFKTTYSYDLMISNYLDDSNKQNNKNINFKLVQAEELRYGENPHQRSSFYLPEKEERKWKQLNGKKLSYNNYFDIETAISIVYEFDEIACSIIKHANPCGFALGKTLRQAYNNAISCDPISYFGGIVGFNKEVNSAVANELVKPFLECIIAPSYSNNALEVFKKKKNLRIIQIDPTSNFVNLQLLRSVMGGFIIQDDFPATRPVSPIDMVNELSCPLLGLFGEEDPNPSPEHADRLKEELDKHGKTYEMRMYPDAGHAFFADYRDSYNPIAAQDMWHRVLLFYGQHLRN